MVISIGISGMGAGPLIANVLPANSPQAVLSFLYLTYNGIFTCMLSADEWGRLAHQRKTLRVTSPAGNQRSNYYLQLPYAFALPLLAISGTLHWLVSQSIFLARVAYYDVNGNYNGNFSFSTCGYSCIAIIFVIAVGSVVVLGGIGFGFRRYPAGIPLAAGCSAAISAACHPSPHEDEDASVLPLRWGAVSTDHCSFSAGPVENPVAGSLYAGMGRK
ncbi:MAG: hypothetical protein M1839_003037 [Geoglossum umbratile]|nr:MAG: hypothetical protein M1839_003037 [Geoglossum umbratile]